MLTVINKEDNNIIIFRSNIKLDNCNPKFTLRIFDSNSTYVNEVEVEDEGECINNYIKANLNTNIFDYVSGMHYIDIIYKKDTDDGIIECLVWNGILNIIDKPYVYNTTYFDNIPEYKF